MPKTPHGFGVDSDGRIYLGDDRHISIYENGIEIDRIMTPTDRGYYMTITNDIIVIGTGTHCYQLALDGTTISSEYEPESETINVLQYQEICSTLSGNEYQLVNRNGRLCIAEVGAEGEEPVFVIPLHIQMKPVMEILAPLSFVSVIIAFLCWFRSGIKKMH